MTETLLTYLANEALETLADGLRQRQEDVIQDATAALEDWWTVRNVQPNWHRYPCAAKYFAEITGYEVDYNR